MARKGKRRMALIIQVRNIPHAVIPSPTPSHALAPFALTQRTTWRRPDTGSTCVWRGMTRTYELSQGYARRGLSCEVIFYDITWRICGRDREINVKPEISKNVQKKYPNSYKAIAFDVYAPRPPRRLIARLMFWQKQTTRGAVLLKAKKYVCVLPCKKVPRDHSKISTNHI